MNIDFVAASSGWVSAGLVFAAWMWILFVHIPKKIGDLEQEAELLGERLERGRAENRELKAEFARLVAERARLKAERARLNDRLDTLFPAGESPAESPPNIPERNEP